MCDITTTLDLLTEKIHSFRPDREYIERGLAHQSKSDVNFIYNTKDDDTFFKGVVTGRMFESMIYEYLVDIVSSLDEFEYILEGGARITRKVKSNTSYLRFHTANSRTNVGCMSRELSEFDALILCPKCVFNIEIHKGNQNMSSFKTKWHRRHLLLQELFPKTEIITIIISDKLGDVALSDDMIRSCTVKISAEKEDIRSNLPDGGVFNLPERDKILPLDRVYVRPINYIKRETRIKESFIRLVNDGKTYDDVEALMKSVLLLSKLEVFTTDIRSLLDSLDADILDDIGVLTEPPDDNKVVFMIDCETFQPQIYVEGVKKHFTRINFINGKMTIYKKKEIGPPAGKFYGLLKGFKKTIDTEFVKRCVMLFLQYGVKPEVHS